MKIFSIYLFIVFTYYSSIIYSQENINLREVTSNYNFFENNGYKVEFDQNGFDILNGRDVVLSKSVPGIKSIKTSSDLNFTVIECFDNSQNKNISLNRIFVFSKNYDIVLETIDTVYSDYSANLYSINNRGQFITYDINNNIIRIANKEDVKIVSLPYDYNVKTESQHYLFTDESYIYVIKNITNPIEDEVLPGFTILYKINLKTSEIYDIKIPINVLTAYLISNDSYIFSGSDGLNEKTILYDSNFNKKSEISKRFNLMFKFNTSNFIGITNKQLIEYDYSFNQIRLKTLDDMYTKVDYFVKNNEYYLITFTNDLCKISKLSYNQNQIFISQKADFKTLNFAQCLKLSKIFIFDKNKTIILH